MQAQSTLMLLYVQQGRFEDSARLGRDVLARYQMASSVKCQVHMEIAMCLECLGRDDEARAERKLAADRLAIPPVDPAGWLVQGRLFAEKKRFDLAIDAYERA